MMKRKIFCIALSLMLVLTMMPSVAFAEGTDNTCTSSHDYSTEWSKNDVAHYHECTDCGERKDAALHYYYNDCYPFCVVCGYERTAHAHVYDDDCSATCSTCGHVRSVAFAYDNDCDTDCNLCGKTRVVEHTPSSEWKQDYYEHWHTCDCGKTVSDRADHTFGDDGSCTVCGAKDETSKGLTYQLLTNDTYMVVIKGSCTDTVLIIPKTHAGKPVSLIYNNAFRDQAELTDVVIPSSISGIGMRAFSRCIGLTNVTVPGSCSSLEKSAFKECYNLKTVTLEEGVKSVGPWMFARCSSLQTINLPKKRNEIRRMLASKHEYDNKLQWHDGGLEQDREA